ncbi:MAG: hypothetical protein ACKOYK_06330 [Cyanobium sp.]
MQPPQPPGVKESSRSSTWSPWSSLGAGLLLAGGVTWVVTMTRRRQGREIEGDGDPNGS